MVEKQITQSSNRTVFPKNLRNKEQKENTVVFAYILMFSLFLLRIMVLSKEVRKCETKINQNVQKKTNLKTSLNNLEKIE